MRQNAWKSSNETHSRNEPSLSSPPPTHDWKETLCLTYTKPAAFSNLIATVPRSVLVLCHLGPTKSLIQANACMRPMYSLLSAFSFHIREDMNATFLPYRSLALKSVARRNGFTAQ